MRLAASLSSVFFVGLLVAACSHASSAGPGTNSTIAPDTAVLAAPVVDAGGPAAMTATAVDASVAMTSTATTATNATDASAADFAACAADSDCVAVKKNACCPHGELAAVASAHADDYKSSFKCEGRKPLCPMFLRLDTRVAICDASTQHCAMAAPNSITCGAAGGHSCPTGFHCASNVCTK